MILLPIPPEANILIRLSNQKKQLFWSKMLISDNIVLAVFYHAALSKFVAVGSLFGISTWTFSAAKIE